MTEKILLKMHW